MTRHGEVLVDDLFPGAGIRISAAFRCDNCNTLSIATTNHGERSQGASQDRALLDRVQDRWYPVRATGKDFPEVPEHIAEGACEAYECLSVGARRAAVQLARSVVEATAKNNGIVKRQIADKIDALFDQRFIREHIRDGAHEIRHLGNEMAHGDFVEPVSAEEADLVLTLMSEVLDEVYQSRARVEKAKAARAQKQGKSASH